MYLDPKVTPKLEIPKHKPFFSIGTWNSNDPCFGWKRPCFVGLTFKNRGHLGSRYLWVIFPKIPCWWIGCNTSYGKWLGGPLLPCPRSESPLPKADFQANPVKLHELVTSNPTCFAQKSCLKQPLLQKFNPRICVLLYGGCRKFLLLFGRIGPLALRPCALLRAWVFFPHSINILQIPLWYGDMMWYGVSCARPCALLRGPAFLMPLYHALKILSPPKMWLKGRGFL